MAASDVVVIDNGSGFVKAGYAADNLPRYTFPSIVGRPFLRAEEEALGDVELEDVMVGEEASAMRRALELSHPVENGVVRNWEDMGHVWDHLLRGKMGLDSGAAASKRVLLTEAPMNPRENRCRMVETMFETFGFGGVRVEMQAMLTLYGQGLMSGLVVDSGDGVTHAVAVHEGYCPPHLTRRLDVAGRHVTAHLIKLLLLRGYAFNSTADFHSLSELKESLCYVALEPGKDRALAEQTTALLETYTLPDGRAVKLGRERFEAPEALFRPSLIDVEAPGLSDMVFDLIQASDMDMRPSLYSSIILSGGNTMFPGLSSRLHKDLKDRYLADILKGDKSRLGKISINVADPPRRKHLVFLGASVLGDIMKGTPEFWWSRAEYQEHGVARLMDIKEGRIKR